MATSKSVWGIDIGQVALKAVKLVSVDDELQVEAFDVIEHPRILSQPDVDRRQLIRVALEQFLARNNVSGSTVAIAVPGQASFTRFVKLPPVEKKRIPDIVKFEAEQQIPFKIDEVIWRYQTFHDPDNPDVELGIFAMKRVDVDDMLSHFADVEMHVDIVQMAPLALYNFMTYDAQTSEEGATLLADVGADKTDLVVFDGPRMWTRTIQIGGNNFTEALVRAFKLTFAKAEKLKRSAASSKYARQIFQAMRPVFADLVQEMQRSIGFYTSLHRESRFKRLIGLGNGFRLPGLQKFLEQNLNIPVVRIDNFNKITPSPTVNAPAFTENVLSFAVAYGLALQGIAQTAITTNLLPGEVARQRSWVAKQPWFVGAAAAVLLGLGLGVFRGYADQGTLGPPTVLQGGAEGFKDLTDANQKVVQLERLRDEFSRVTKGTDSEKALVEVNYKLLGYRQVWPCIDAMISQAIASEFPDQGRLLQMCSGDQAAFDKGRAELAAKPRPERAIVFVESIVPKYDLQIDGPTATPKRPGFTVTLKGRTPLPELRTDQALRKIRSDSKAIAHRLVLAAVAGQPQAPKDAKDFKDFMEVIDVTVAMNPGATAATPTPSPTVVPTAGTPGGKILDGLFPEESALALRDVPFVITWKIAINNDGVWVPQEPKP